MSYRKSLAVLAVNIVFATSYAAAESREDVRNDSTKTLANAPQATPVELVQQQALSSMTWGDKWQATNLLERAEIAHDTVFNRFNLAVGYQATGRQADAARIYRELMVDGRNASSVTVPDEHNRAAWDRRVNIAEESARRLAAMSPGVNLAGGALSASSLGVPVSATSGGEGSPGYRYISASRVSDQRALELDVAQSPGE